MKDVFRLWRGRYSAVSTSEIQRGNSNSQRRSSSIKSQKLEGTVEEMSCLNQNGPYTECDIERADVLYSTRRSFKQVTPHPLSKANSIVDSFFQPRKAGERARYPKCVFLMMVMGLAGIGAGCFILAVHPYDVLFRLKCVFSDGGEVFELWRKPPVDLYLKIYLFNITNAQEFLDGRDDKIHVEDVGPYVFREYISHGNITFNSNGTVSAIPHHPLVFEQEMSGNRTLEDIMMLPNIALLSMAEVMSNSMYFTRLAINLIIKQTKSEPLVKVTAKDFMFGYESPLVTIGNNLLPGWIKFDKLGLIDRMYDFEGDYLTAYTGETRVENSGLLDTYRGSSGLPQWTGQCSNIQNASDGTKFPSNIQRDDTLLFFRKSMCRAQNVVRDGNETIFDGLKAFKYIFQEDSLDNGRRNKNNSCFCRDGQCLPDGLVDVRDCYYGFPIALSYPHFYQADPEIANKVEITPFNKSQHESYFIIQPESGLPLQVAARFQINMNFKDISNMAKVERFSNMVLPLLWFEFSMISLPQSLLDRFNLYLNILPLVETSAKYFFFISGTIILIASVVRVVLTAPFGGKNISESLKQRNIILGSKNWESAKTDSIKTNNHVIGFDNADVKVVETLSDKYLGENISDIYKPCEQTDMKQEHCNKLASWISFDKLSELKDKINDGLELINEKLQTRSDHDSKDKIVDEANATEEIITLEKALNSVRSKRPFSENKAFNEFNDTFSSHETLKLGDVSDKLSDIEKNDFTDRVSMCSQDSDDCYDDVDLLPTLESVKIDLRIVET